MCEIDFDSIYLLITTLLRFNSLRSKENCQIILALLANEKNQSHFLENNCFCQVICKYTSVITSREIKALVAYKALWLFIFKVNVKTLEKFDVLAIAQYQCYCAPILITVLRTCTGIEIVDNN